MQVATPVTSRSIAVASAVLALAVTTALVTAGTTSAKARSATRSAKVTISGGLSTDARDHGRPVVLIAAALGVPTAVFRDAFSRVTPAGTDSGGPDEALAQRNKQALLATLAPYGVTNDRLDEVSNYYRYNGAAGEMWPYTSARATAKIRDGKVAGITVTRAGSGYTTRPTVRVSGYPDAKVTVRLGHSTTFTRNGRVASLSIS